MTLSQLARSTLLVAAAACSPPDPGHADAPIDTPPDTPALPRHDVLDLKAVQNPDLDVLFVIDDSPSMADKQNALARGWAGLLAQLQLVPGGLPNLHIGVATSDMGTKGSADATPGPNIGAIGQGGCGGLGKNGVLQTTGAPITGNNFVISNRDGTKNFTGALNDTLAQMTRVGQGGCGFEQHLAAMRAALGDNPANTGFLRAGANLAVVILGDEDDCSILHSTMLGPESPALGPLQSYRCTRFGVTCNEDITTIGTKTGCKPAASSAYVEDVAPFQAFLLGLKQGDPRRLMFGLIVSDPTKVAIETRIPPAGGAPQTALAHSCSYTGVAGTLVGDPAVRMAALAGGFPGRAAVTSVCSDELTPSVTDIGRGIKHLVGDSCLEKAIAMPEDCIAVDIRDSAPGQETILPRCGAGATGDCFDLVADPSCTDGAPLLLAVTRAQPAPADLWTTVRCTTGS